MLLIVEKGIRRRVCHSIYQYAKDNNKCNKVYDKNNGSSYFQYWQYLPERPKIEKAEKLAANLHNKTEYVIHIRNLKQALNHRLVLKNVHRVIKFNQISWLKSFIYMNTDLRKKRKKWFEKDFF